MSDRSSLKQAYKQRKVTGGVGVVRNTADGRVLIESATDIDAKRNRFSFAKSSGLCIYPKLDKDWARLGPSAFEYEVLEELVKQEDETEKQFKEDLKLLELIWLEKFPESSRY